MSRSESASGPPEEGVAEASPGQVDWGKLPDALRSRLADLAATAVGAMPATDVPVPLRRLARFTPAKRAKLGGPALTAELEASAAFRTAVVAWWEEHRPGELTTVDRELAAVVIATGPDENARDNVATTRIVIKQPVLTVDQQAGPLGGVVSLQGKDFPPGAKIRLGWTIGISETPGEIISADGTFATQMLVFHNDAEGVRQAQATSLEGTKFGEVKSGDFLALPNTVQPSDFVERG